VFHDNFRTVYIAYSPEFPLLPNAQQISDYDKLARFPVGEITESGEANAEHKTRRNLQIKQHKETQEK